jgi:F0F1-type ATP synthase assembly protein I
MDPERPLKPEPGSENPSPASKLTESGAGAAAGMGLQFAISVLLFLLAGQWLDRKLNTSPLFLMVFVFVGAGGSFYSIYRKLMEQQRREDEERRKRP